MKSTNGDLNLIFPPLKAVNGEARKNLEPFVKHFSYKKKQVIFQAAFPPTGLYIIKTGKVKIFKTSESGKEIIIHIAGEHEMLGYSALIRKKDHHFWAETIECCELIYIPKDVFYELQDSHPEFSLAMMVSFFNYFDYVVDKLVDIVSNQVRKRIAKILLRLADTHGLEKDNITIAITLSRQDMAHLVATNVETLVRTLSDFRQEKIVALNGKKISIIDMAKLNRVANLP
jgi:CRP/FNR family transcriptional regulator